VSVNTPPGTVGPGANATLSAGGGFAGSNPAAAPVYNMPPAMINNQAMGLLGVNNHSLYYRNLGGTQTIASVMFKVAAAAGNIAVAVFAGTPGQTKPTTRIAYSGSVPCPAAGVAVVALDRPVYCDQTCWLAFGGDTLTGVQLAGFSGPGWIQDSSWTVGTALWWNGGWPIPAAGVPAGFVCAYGIVPYFQGV
jgi:hypothetical protein